MVRFAQKIPSGAEFAEFFLAGTFNDWDSSARPMKKDARGIWRTRLSLEPGVYDSQCEECRENDYGTCNCVVRV